MGLKITLMFLIALGMGELAAAQNKISGTVHCDKPSDQQSLEVGDRPNHSFMITKGTCTWTKPVEMGERLLSVYADDSGHRRRLKRRRVGSLDGSLSRLAAPWRIDPATCWWQVLLQLAALVAVLVRKTQPCAALHRDAGSLTRAKSCNHRALARVLPDPAEACVTVHKCACRDLKSLGPQGSCRFDSGPPHRFRRA